MEFFWGTEVSRYIVRCPDGNHLGYPYWDKVILNFLNGRTRLHDVFNKHKSKIDQIILKYTNKVIELSFRYPAFPMAC